MSAAVATCGIRASDCPGFRLTYPEIETCPGCGLGRTIQATLSIKEQNYLDPTEVGGSERPEYFRDLYEAYVADCVPGRSLDVGCGRGEWVRTLKARGWIAHGIDSYNNFQPDGVSLFCSSLAEFEPTGLYDLVTLVHCFEHIKDPIAALGKITRMLTPAGRLLICVPNFAGVWSKICRDHWHMLKTEHHVYHYTPASLKSLLATSGYEIICVRTYSGFAPSPWEIRLYDARFYDRGIGAIRPIQSIMFRLNSLFRPMLNALTDRRLGGAEIQIVAQVHSSARAIRRF